MEYNFFKRYEDDSNVVYCTKNELVQEYASEHGQPTWYEISVPEEKAEEVEEIINISLTEYKDGVYTLCVCAKDCGYDDLDAVYEDDLREISNIDGVEVSEQEYVYVLPDPEGATSLLFSHSDFGDFEDECEWVFDDELEECVKGMKEVDEDINRTYYEWDKHPNWEIYSSRDKYEQWYDYCIIMHDDDEYED